MSNGNPIGVFDSGVGGLSILKALTEALPCEDFFYLGDTARVPYGDKTPETIAAYALEAAHTLEQCDAKMLVVACNTVTAMALPVLQKMLPYMPCLGVIEPTARQAAQLSCCGKIAVLSTAATARHNAYSVAIKRYRADADVRMLGCGSLVDLVERGICDGPEAEAAVAHYLQQLDADFDTLVLGCTHFPFLAATLRKLIAASVSIVDGVKATVETVQETLLADGLLNPSPDKGYVDFYTTGMPEPFTLIAKQFLGVEAVPLVEQIELAGLDEAKILQPKFLESVRRGRALGRRTASAR